MGTPKREIRKLTWGIIPTLPTFNISVGQNVGLNRQLEVIAIVEELLENGNFVYHIEVKTKTHQVFFWKTFNKLPDEIEYDSTKDYLKV